MHQLAELEVVNRELYRDRVPVKHGILDRRLGISSKTAACETCGLRLAECAGHFGVLQLTLPVFHVGFFKATCQALACICKSCSALLLPESEKDLLRKRLFLDAATQRASVARAVYDKCRKISTCLRCGAKNAAIKRVAPLLCRLNA